MHELDVVSCLAGNVHVAGGVLHVVLVLQGLDHLGEGVVAHPLGQVQRRDHLAQWITFEFEGLCTVGNQMLLALWGAKSGIAKMGFWASLVIPRSQKTKVKKIF